MMKVMNGISANFGTKKNVLSLSNAVKFLNRIIFFTTAGISNKTPTNIYNHGFDEVPFIEFPNNNTFNK